MKNLNIVHYWPLPSIRTNRIVLIKLFFIILATTSFSRLNAAEIKRKHTRSENKSHLSKHNLTESENALISSDNVEMDQIEIGDISGELPKRRREKLEIRDKLKIEKKIKEIKDNQDKPKKGD